MCKKQVSVPEVDNSKNLETSNYGLINLEENNLGTMGILEVVSVILLVLAVIMTCHYCNRKRKQTRMRDLNNALKDLDLYQLCNLKTRGQESCRCKPYLLRLRNTPLNQLRHSWASGSNAADQSLLGIWTNQTEIGFWNGSFFWTFHHFLWRQQKTYALLWIWIIFRFNIFADQEYIFSR